jgi:NAD(P)H-nitrite reductase large subunit
VVHNGPHPLGRNIDRGGGGAVLAVGLVAAAAAGRAGPGRGYGAAGPERTVCRCAGVSGTKIAAAVASGCGTIAEVSGATRAGTGCGGCHDDITGIIEKHFQGAVA